MASTAAMELINSNGMAIISMGTPPFLSPIQSSAKLPYQFLPLLPPPNRGKESIHRKQTTEMTLGRKFVILIACLTELEFQRRWHERASLWRKRIVRRRLYRYRDGCSLKPLWRYFMLVVGWSASRRWDVVCVVWDWIESCERVARRDQEKRRVCRWNVSSVWPNLVIN